MTKILKAVSGLNDLEEMADRKTIVHDFHPLSKIIVTFVFLITVISFDRYQISSLLPFVLYPVLMMTLSMTPFKPLFYRLLPALPFSLFGGISNIIFDQIPMFTIVFLTVTSGMISFVSIMVKVVLTVSAVLILVATTPVTVISKQLTKIGIPSLLVLQFVMTYRYISVLVEEAVTMMTAYTVRAPRHKFVQMKDMGSFVGHLLLRSIDRAERVYAAMKSRGFNGTYVTAPIPKVGIKDILFTVGACSFFLICRFVNISLVIGNFFTGVFA